MEWSASQLTALQAVDAGESVFITGPGGVGKSALIEAIKQSFHSKHLKLAVTATTGVAAVTIGGKTIDSFMRLTPLSCAQTKEDVAHSHSKNKYFVKEIMETRALIIDEVSMMSAEIFVKIDWILKICRRSSKPFGGLQTVLVGDFFQLPPTKSSAYIFQLPEFFALIDTLCILKEVFRQKDDQFIGILHRARCGDISKEDMEVLNSRVHAKLACEDIGILPTLLYATNKKVDEENKSKLALLDSETHSFKSVRGVWPSKQCSPDQRQMLESRTTKLLYNLNLNETTELKIGAQVMLIYNLDTVNGYVNGSRGVIIDFHHQKDYDYDSESLYLDKKNTENILYPNIGLPVVRFHNGRVLLIPMMKWTVEDTCGTGLVWQLPLRLAWSTTIHKSQSQSLDAVHIDISDVFADGQAYVALSRVTSLQGLKLSFAVHSGTFKVSNDVKKFYESDYGSLRQKTLTPPSSEMASEEEVLQLFSNCK